MANKKITDLQLRSSVTDDVNLPSDDGVQSYRVTALQFKNYVLATGNVLKAMLATAIQEALVPVGSVLPFAGLVAPSGYLFPDGSELSRTTYANLFAALNLTVTGSVTNASTTITVPSTTALSPTNFVSGPGIPAGATIVSITNATSFVISAAATATNASASIVISPHGLGNGTTTFNLPNTRGLFIRSAGSQSVGGETFAGTLGLKTSDATAKNGLYDPGHKHSSGVNGELGVQTTRYGYREAFTGNGARIVSTGGQAYDPWTSTEYVNITSSDAETKPANISFNHIIKY